MDEEGCDVHVAALQLPPIVGAAGDDRVVESVGHPKFVAAPVVDQWLGTPGKLNDREDLPREIGIETGPSWSKC